MKAFVTGATGFLGINLIKLLIEQRWEVVAFSRPGADRSALTSLPIDWREGQLVSKNDIEQAIDNDIDVIFHLAGDTNMWAKNDARQFEVNVTATQYLLEVAVSKHIAKFIHTSSISAYGFHDDVITESTPSKAMSSNVNYLKTKFLGEQLVKRAVLNDALNAVIINPCAIIGAYDKHNWSQLFGLIKDNQLPGVPKGEGSYCHVKEVAKAHISAVTKGQAGHNYILAGVDHSFLEVVNLIAEMVDRPKYKKTVSPFILKTIGWGSYWLSKVTGKEPHMTPEKATMVSKRVVAKSDKAVSELGYNDKVPLTTMLKECYDWLKSENKI